MDELFLEVWCKADPIVDYSIELLPQELKEIVLDIYNSSRTSDYLYGPIERIYNVFQKLSQSVKDQLAHAYIHNNSIEELCKNDNCSEPILYSELKLINDVLGNEQEIFFKNLFIKVIHLKSVKEKIGELDSHYDEFITVNDEGKCPFCGINDIKGRYVSKREAYDHFLPKDIYPFNSINFHNLAPMCHECNSSYKLKTDPLHKNDHVTRRKAFYPFDQSSNPNIQIKISFLSKDISSLAPEEIKLDISSPGHDEEVEAWKEVFGIEERYKAKCLEKDYGKYWLIQAIDEYNNFPEAVKNHYTKEEWIQKQINEAKTNLYANGNFIKAEFLETCRRIGIF